MDRALMEKLKEWQHSKNRKPLILWGARQVGKTWLLKEFGRTCFENVAYISFYNNRPAAQLFEQDFNIERITSGIRALTHQSVDPERTLIVFDEIQDTPRVLESLKYFCEDAPRYAVAAAGSLLGVSLHQGVSFPVGKVDELRLYPLSFREFLRALGEPALADGLEDLADPIVNDLCDVYRDLLRQYMFVGGMPAAVQEYSESRDTEVVRGIQSAIVSQYEGDFGKHIEPRLLPRIRMTWQAVPMQLAKENRKFFFGQVKEGARMKDFELAIQWLCDAGLLYKVHKVEKPAVPPKAYVDFTAFKLFMTDVGLLGALSGLDSRSLLEGNRIFTEFKGALTEQYVLQELVAGGRYTPYYYSGEGSTYEMDLLIQKGMGVVPLEVKAEENLRSKSLKVYCEKFKPAEAIRTSMSCYRKQDWMTNVPLWAVGSI